MAEEKKTLINDLTTGSVPRQLIKFTAPLFMSGILQTVYNLVDMMVVGRFCGSEGIVAVSNGGDVLNFLMFLALGFASAGQIIISQYIGANRRDLVKKLIGTLFTFLIGCAVILTVVFLILSNNIMVWLRIPPEARELTHDYIIVCICGLVFIYGYNLVSAILRGMGDSKHPFLFIAIAAITNLVLDILFVAVFRMQAFGAALATVIGQAISFITAITFLYRRREQFGFDFKRSSFGIDMEVFPPLVKLGIPMMLQYASVLFSKLFVASWINSYGKVGAAVTGIGNKLNMFMQTFGSSLSTAGGSMAAQNIGAEKYDRVPKIMLTAFEIGAVAAVLFSAVTILFPRAVFGIFTSEKDVLDMAISFVPVAVMYFCSCALRPPANTLISGSGNAKLNLVIAILDGIVMRIGLDLLLGLALGWGLRGFWYGSAITSYTPFVVGFIYFLTGKWRTRKYILGRSGIKS